MAYKGKFKPKHIKKYKGDPTQIVYRSLWEKKFMGYCTLYLCTQAMVDFFSMDIIQINPITGMLAFLKRICLPCSPLIHKRPRVSFFCRLRKHIEIYVPV